MVVISFNYGMELYIEKYIYHLDFIKPGLITVYTQQIYTQM